MLKQENGQLNNPYFLTNEFSKLSGFKYNAETALQIESIKEMLWDIINVWSFLIHTGMQKAEGNITEEQIKKFNRVCNSISQGEYSHTSDYFVKNAGLDQTAYLNDVKKLAETFKTASNSELKKLTSSPFALTIKRIASVPAWREPKLNGTPETSAQERLEYALTVYQQSGLSPKFLDIFSILHDSTHNAQNSAQAEDAAIRFVHHLKYLAFGENSRAKSDPTER